MPRPPDLPNYRRPPIDEVVIGLQFLPVPGLSEAHVGLFWQLVRDDFPRADSQPRLEGPVEDLSGSFGGGQPILIQSGGPGRIWLTSEDESYLLQIQNTRFIQNWRLREDAYPHFDELAERFWRYWNMFERLLEQETLGETFLQQLEVSYINWVQDLPMETFFTPAALPAVRTPGLSPEDQNLAARFIARDTAGSAFARVYVQCQPAMRLEPAGVIGSQVTLTFRAPLSPAHGRPQIEGLLDFARAAIVQTFTDLTTDQAHEAWERFQ